MHLLILIAALVVDGHADTPQFLLDTGADLLDQTALDVDLAKARRGGMGGEFFAIWVDPELYPAGKAALRAFDLIDSVRAQVEKHPAQLALALTAAEVEKAQAAHKLAVLMGIEGGHAIEGDLRVLRDFYRLGARYMTLTWSNTNDIGDSSGDVTDAKVPHHDGLTPFGKQVVEEMNRLGMLIDISHVADKTFFDAVALSKAPVIASHSSARALSQHARNMTDEMLQAVAKNGGVVMVNFFSAFVDEEYRKAFTAAWPETQKAVREVEVKYANDPAARTRETFRVGKELAAKIPRPPLKSLIDQIDHVAKVAGIDHVGIGSDFDGIPSMPQGIDSAADLPKIFSELRKRGYTPKQCDKIASGNILRVMRAAEKARR